MGYKTESNIQSKLIDTENSMVVTKKEWGWGEHEEGKGDQIYGDRRRLEHGW